MSSHMLFLTVITAVTLVLIRIEAVDIYRPKHKAYIACFLAVYVNFDAEFGSPR